MKQKIINFADGPLMCPTRPASSPVYIKPGLTNALIGEKNICRLAVTPWLKFKQADPVQDFTPEKSSSWLHA